MRLPQKHILWGISGLLIGSIFTQSVQPAQKIAVLPAHTHVTVTVIPSHTPTPTFTITPTATITPLPTRRPLIIPTKIPLPTLEPTVHTLPTNTPAPVYQATVQQSTPSGATALCADGTLSFSAHHSGTCSHHGGVSQWY